MHVAAGDGAVVSGLRGSNNCGDQRRNRDPAQALMDFQHVGAFAEQRLLLGVSLRLFRRETQFAQRGLLRRAGGIQRKSSVCEPPATRDRFVDLALITFFTETFAWGTGSPAPFLTTPESAVPAICAGILEGNKSETARSARKNRANRIIIGV